MDEQRLLKQLPVHFWTSARGQVELCLTENPPTPGWPWGRTVHSCFSRSTGAGRGSSRHSAGQRSFFLSSLRNWSPYSTAAAAPSLGAEWLGWPLNVQVSLPRSRTSSVPSALLHTSGYGSTPCFAPSSGVLSPCTSRRDHSFPLLYCWQAAALVLVVH